MPKIHFDPSFNKSYKDFVFGNDAKKRKIKKALLLFGANPSYPSINTEKLKGTDIWTIRIDLGNRLFFKWSKDCDTAVFFLVGKHDLYKKVNK